MKVSRRVLRALMKVAKRIEEHPEQHSFFGGRTNSTKKCALVMLGEELKFEGPSDGYYRSVDKKFLNYRGHDIAYRCKYGSYSTVSPPRVAANIREWVAQTCAEQGTRL